MHDCPLDDSILDAAIIGGQLPSARLLVTYGLPRKAYFFAPSSRVVGHVGANQMHCLRYLMEEGRPIDPRTLICAKKRGDLDVVRILESRTY
jgi:hypothetical protein